MAKETYLYGKNSIAEAINSGRNIEKIFVAYPAKESCERIIRAAKREGIATVIYDKKKFQALERKAARPDAKTQGVIALLSQLELSSFEKSLDRAKSKTKYPIFVALDEITDPHNLGAIARSALCAGAYGIIMTQKNSAPLNADAIKASAGALNHMAVIKVGNLAQAMKQAKDEGYWVVGTEMNAKQSYSDKIYDRPMILIIGSEGKGMRPITKKNCDTTIKIPMTGDLDSLNASVSAGVVLFERQRQLLENGDL